MVPLGAAPLSKSAMQCSRICGVGRVVPGPQQIVLRHHDASTFGGTLGSRDFSEPHLGRLWGNNIWYCGVVADWTYRCQCRYVVLFNVFSGTILVLPDSSVSHYFIRHQGVWHRNYFYSSYDLSGMKDLEMSDNSLVELATQLVTRCGQALSRMLRLWRLLFGSDSHTIQELEPLHFRGRSVAGVPLWRVELQRCAELTGPVVSIPREVHIVLQPRGAFIIPSHPSRYSNSRGGLFLPRDAPARTLNAEELSAWHLVE